MVYLVQWTCPNGHMGMANIYESDDATIEDVEREADAFFKAGTNFYLGRFPRKCEVCKAVFRGRTVSVCTIEEATAAVLALADRNTAARNRELELQETV